ncbi:MAG: TRAP transporter small permease subunit [Myxococcota bacterium]
MSVLDRLRRVDDAVFRAERWAIVVVIAIMTLSIFLAVLWRIFSDPEGRLEALLVASLGESDGVRWAGKAISFALFAALCSFAVKTAQKDASPAKAVGLGAVVAGGVYLVGYGFAAALPFGLVFSQRLALALLMWMVFLGSSMAAYKRRHIVVQAALKLVPAEMKHIHGAMSLLIAAGFTVFLWWVSTRYSIEMFNRWVESDFRESRFDSIAIPYWAVTAAVTFGLGITFLRFLLQAVLVFTKAIPAEPLSEEEEALAAATEAAES